jgi:hypothetical protein
MSNSILTSTKKILGIEESYTVFDNDIVLHINSVFSTLSQLGIGPVDGFMIEDASAEWVDFLGNDKRLNSVKTYMYLRVRLLFDPPTTSYHISAMKEEIKEFEWRLNVYREEQSWVDPTLLEDDVIPTPFDGLVFDGGGP